MPCPTVLPDNLVALLPQMTRLARYLTGDRDQAQDLCQEVLLRLWTRLQSGTEITDLRAYAMAALRNQYRQWLRTQVTLANVEDITQVAPSRVFATIALHELQEAIDALPQAQAHLMQLVMAGETSPGSLSRITGWPLGTVMSRLARARAKLRLRVGLARNASTDELL